MAKQIDPAVLTLVKTDWEKAPRGGKTWAVESWAARLNVSFQTLYKAMNTGRKRKKGERKHAKVEEAARVIAQIKARPPEHKGQIVTKDAIKLALDNGKIDDSFADVHPVTFDRIMR